MDRGRRSLRGQRLRTSIGPGRLSSADAGAGVPERVLVSSSVASAPAVVGVMGRDPSTRSRPWPWRMKGERGTARASMGQYSTRPVTGTRIQRQRSRGDVSRVETRRPRWLARPDFITITLETSTTRRRMIDDGEVEFRP